MFVVSDILKVKSKLNTTEDCVLVSFIVPDELKSKFQFKQGQYITLSRNINGELLKRNYSICAAPGEGELRIGVKKILGGRFSTFINDRLKVGDELEVLPPSGKFNIELEPRIQRNYMAFAAGSGITPIYSIIKTHLEVEKKSRFSLFYVNKTVSSIILKDELDALKNTYMDRFDVHYILTRQQQFAPLLNGRITKEKLSYIFEVFTHLDTYDHFFLCGPEPMIQTIRNFLLDNKVGEDQIHFELFGVNSVSSQRKMRQLETEYKGLLCDITVKEGGRITRYKTLQGKETVLDSALRNSVDLPFACKGGVCCTCKARLVKGEVEMLVNYGLEDDEILKGYVLSCQSIPTSDYLEIDFDV